MDHGRQVSPRSGFWLVRKRLDSGPQNWKQYLASLLIFNTALFVFGFLVLALQKWTPLNPDHKTMLAPSTILHSVVSFMTNTDLQHYSGDQHLSISVRSSSESRISSFLQQLGSVH